MKNLDISTIMKQYVDQGLSLRQVSELHGTNHHTIKRALIRNGVSINSDRKRANVTPESRERMSLSAKRRPNLLLDLPRTLDRTLKMQAKKLGTTRDLSVYSDRERFLFLVWYTSARKDICTAPTAEERDTRRFEFIDRFYDDPQLSAIWVEWKARGECKWWRPSLDHKVPTSRGGTFDLDNLHFLTWFENRAKADMTEDEWMAFQKATGTASALFVRVNS